MVAPGQNGKPDIASYPVQRIDEILVPTDWHQLIVAAVERQMGIFFKRSAQAVTTNGALIGAMAVNGSGCL